MSSDNYTNLIAGLRRKAKMFERVLDGKNETEILLIEAADALESVVRDRNKANEMLMDYQTRSEYENGAIAVSNAAWQVAEKRVNEARAKELEDAAQLVHGGWYVGEYMWMSTFEWLRARAAAIREEGEA